jgi:hypothetical protein
LNLESQTQPTVEQAQLGRVVVALRTLHRTLVGSVQAGFERLHGKVKGPNQLLGLLLNDPLFAWLRPLSQLITELDDVCEGDPRIGQASLAAIRERVARFTSEAGENAEFAAHYLTLLQSDPDVVVAHAVLHKQLAQLPSSAPQPGKDPAS